MNTFHLSMLRGAAALSAVSALSMPFQALAESPPVRAELPQDAAQKTVPTSWRLTDETYKLPGGERMGMAGATMFFDVTEQWRLGVASYGAVRGERGGFITLGAAGEWFQALSEDWSVRAGLFVGAGGGRGGGTLAGGGLMLRSDVGLSYALAPWGRVGLGVSHVSFPSGTISSTQPYVMFEHTFHTLFGPGWLDAKTGSASALGLSIQAQEIAAVARAYNIADSAVQDNGAPQYGRMQLLGFEWLGYLDDRWFLKLEADGAMGGRSDGYMQIFAGGGYRWPLTQSTGLKLHAALGPAGGGRVDTGGGVLLDAGVSLQQDISRNLALEVTLGGVASPAQSFKAASLSLKLSHRFGLPAVGAGAVSGTDLMGLSPEHMRVRLASQTYLNPSDKWRNGNLDQTVSNLGVQFDYFVQPNWFLTGQGLAAYSGKAGSYMKGLIGAGARLPLSDDFFAEGEALVGAAGGGGLSVGGGLVGQVNASVGYHLSKSLSLMATVGHFTAPKGNLSAQVAGVALAYQFSVFAAR